MADLLQQPVIKHDDDDENIPQVGLRSKRGCTDVWCLLVFIVMWALLIFVAYLGFANGNPSRLLYGTDYMGNVCGRGDGPPAGLEHLSDWSDRKLLWYPITFDPITRKMLAVEAIDLGVCVKECPKSSDVSITLYQNSSAETSPVTYPILFDSSSQFYRCLPDFLTFNCANVSDCMNGLQSAASQFGGVNEALELGQAGFREIVNGWWVILVGLIAAVLISFLWIFTLRRTVKPVVVLMIVLVMGFLIGGGFACFYQMKSIKDDPLNQGSDAWKMWLAAAIILWGFAFICLCVIIFVGKNIMIACDVVEEAAKVPISIPTMNVVPLIVFASTLPFAVFAIIIAVYVQSCGDTLEIHGYMPVYNNNTNFADIASLMSNTSAVQQYYTAHTYQFQGWRVFAQIYNLFMLLWMLGLLNAIGFMIFALCSTFWYWSKPGDDKEPPLGSVVIAFKLCMRYHLGSLALGSFIVAVVQTMRVLLVFIEQKAKKAGVSNQEQVKFIIRMIHCCLACMERVIKLINKNAYIVMAHDGTKSFLGAALEAVNLLTGNIVTVGFTTVIAELFIFFGKFQIALFAGGVTFLMTHYIEAAGSGVSKGIILIFIVTIVAYLIATLFLSVLSCCVDSILLCFCFDKIHTKIDYFPTDLAKHLDVKIDECKAKHMAHEMRMAQRDADSVLNGGSDNMSAGGGGGGGVLHKPSEPSMEDL